MINYELFRHILQHPSLFKSTYCPLSDSINKFQVFRALDHLRHTTTGLGGIPA